MYLDRELLGQYVRAAWVGWAGQQANPKPSWLLSWDEMEEWEREVDRRIGEFVALRIREEETQRLSGLYHVWHWIERTIAEESDLAEFVGSTSRMSDWVELVGREVLRAASESFSESNFTRRMTRVAAYAILAIKQTQEAACKKGREGLSSSNPAPIENMHYV